MQLITNGSILVGINLGFDAAAEHEMGVTHLREWLAMGDHAKTTGVMRKRPNFGAKVRRDWLRKDAGPGKRIPTCNRKKIAARTHLVEFGDTQKKPAETHLLFYTHPSDRVWQHRKEALETRADDPWLPFRPRSPRKAPGPDLGTMWSDKGFAIRAFGDRERDAVREIHEALLKGNLAIGLGGRTLFGEGLSLMIADRIPREDGDAVLARDLDHMRLVWMPRGVQGQIEPRETVIECVLMSGL
ncbi:hypothetical protein Salmuc_03473 [Salipiger mucosus DSM 16094]|uniref:Uncharacterized protein n=1 Tax=Salipiger mucosus DSM 16094 TaxID=1123237 RepID=S9Q9U2_9RHOB|nr:hypothetical protein Salmuc_03473 [Salipiger mucosus DSM 16094]